MELIVSEANGTKDGLEIFQCICVHYVALQLLSLIIRSMTHGFDGQMSDEAADFETAANWEDVKCFG
jgi:hypothetical protein